MVAFVPGVGSPTTKLIFVGEAPGVQEDQVGEPFVGKSGEFLDGVLSELGHPSWRSEFYITNCYKYRPPNNDIKRIAEVCNPEQQIELLWKEIWSIKPNAICALGNTPLKILTGCDKILKYRGSILPSKYGIPKVIPTIHPSAIIRSAGSEYEDGAPAGGPLNYIWRRVMINDIERAIEESFTEKLDLPQKYIKVCTTSSDLNKFAREGHGRDRLYLDIETYSSTMPMCVGLSWDQHSCLVVPLIRDIGGKEITTIPTSDLAFIWQLLQELFSKYEVAGQNLKFDIPKLQSLGFTFRSHIKSDLMFKAHTINPEMPKKSLGFLTSLYTRMPFYKDEGKEFVFGRDDINKYFQYNGKDVCASAEIDIEMDKELGELDNEYNIELKKFYYDFVVKKHSFYCDVERLGLRIDYQTRDYLTSKYEIWLDSLDRRLSAMLKKPINFRSPKQLSELIFDDLKVPTYKIPKGKKYYKTDEDVISKLLRDTIKDNFRVTVLELILERRRVAKTLDTYLYSLPDLDGRARTSVNIVGTENGRSSTSIVGPPDRPYECGQAFQTLTKHGEIGGDIREQYIPDEGMIFVNIDKSQAEARVVALLAEDYKLLEAMDHIDVHRRTARCALIDGVMNLDYGFDKLADKIPKEGGERFIGKKSRHATNYDMGWREFLTQLITEARRNNLDITLSKFKVEQILTRIHTATPNTREVFHKEVRACLDTTRALINPFGRIRRFFGRFDERIYKEGFACIPQSTVIDDLMRSLMQVRDLKFPVFKPKGMGIAIESHDNGLFQMPIGEYVDICKEIKPIMEQPIDFSKCSLKRGVLVIPVEFEVGMNLKNLEKLKIE
jgi:DNA polymerase